MNKKSKMQQTTSIIFSRKAILIWAPAILVILIILYVLSNVLNYRNTQPPSHKQLNKILVDFTQYAQYAKQARKTPGMAIAIIKDNKIIYAKGFGVRNTTRAPVTPETIFNIGSITKSFTAALLAIQIEAGKYNWNTKILKLYPKFKLYDPVATKGFEIRDLIAHDSGLPEDTGIISDFGYSNEQIIYALRFIKPVAPFRAKFAYQDVFLTLAQIIIEKNSGVSYSAYLHKKIFTPLGMKNSYTQTDDLSQLPNISEHYLYYRDKVLIYPKSFLYLHKKWGRAIGVASGGINSSVTDLAKWLIFQMNDGAVNGKQIISKKNMQFIHSPQIKIPKGDAESDGADAYCEGWFYNSHKYKPYTIIFHPGNNSGASAMVEYIPKLKIGIVILSNKWDIKLPKALADRFFNMYFKRPVKNWSTIQPITDKDYSYTASTAKTQCTITKVKDLSRYIGTYYNNSFGNVFITKSNGRLVLSIGPKKIKWQLNPCRPNVFKAYWPSGSKYVVMLPENKSLVKFSAGVNKKIHKMQVDYLNADGIGVFIKK